MRFVLQGVNSCEAGRALYPSAVLYVRPLGDSTFPRGADTNGQVPQLVRIPPTEYFRAVRSRRELILPVTVDHLRHPWGTSLSSLTRVV